MSEIVVEVSGSPSSLEGRVLARVLAESARGAVVSGGALWAVTNTATDLGDRVDFTFRGGDGDSY
jgi:hypothetical protein